MYFVGWGHSHGGAVPCASHRSTVKNVFTLSHLYFAFWYFRHCHYHVGVHTGQGVFV